MTTNEESRAKGTGSSREPAAVPRRRQRKRGRRTRRGKRRKGQKDFGASPERVESPELLGIMNEFVVCGRCSFFLSGCRVLHGVETLKLAAGAADDSWMELPWTADVRRLLQKSYGFQFDDSWSHFEGCCPECSRCLIYSKSAAEDKTATFKIELKSP